MSDTSATENLKSPANIPIYRWMLRIGIAVVCLVVLTDILLGAKFNSYSLLNHQFNATARSVGLQASLSSLKPLKEQDLESLKLLVDNLAADPFVQRAAIFNQFGELIVASEANPLYQSLLKQPNTLPGISKLTQPVITEISDGQNRLGFIRMTYLTQSAFQQGQAFFNDVFRQATLLLILSCVFTWQLGRGMKGWQFQRYIKKLEQLKSK